MDITLVLTNKCNLKCKYCFVEGKNNDSMSIETAKKSIDFVFESCQEDFLSFCFFGGEPLIEFENMKTIVNYVENKAKQLDKKIKFSVTTNGTIYNEQIGEFLKHHSFDITLSVDGTKYAQDINRITYDNKGSYELVSKNIEGWLQLQKEGLKFSIRMTIEENNVSELFKGVKIYVERGFRRIVFTPNIHNHWNEENIKILEGNYRKISDFYIESYKSGKPFSCSNIEKYIKRYVENKVPGCGAAKVRMAISVNGNFYPCHRFVNGDVNLEVSIGNIFSGYNDFRDSFIATISNIDKQCGECNLINKCGNICPAVNYFNNGKLNDRTWFSCVNEKLSIKESDYVGQNLFKDEKNKYLDFLLFGKYSFKEGLEKEV